MDTRLHEPPVSESSTQPTISERAAEMADKAREYAAQAGSTALETLDHGRYRVADTLERAASGLTRQTMGASDARTARVMSTTACGLGRAAGYLRSHDARMMARDAGKVVKTYPVQTLAGALVAGFLLGKLIRPKY